MKTLFITDLDGTLLDSDGRLSSETSRIISDLTARGALISVATARTPATVEPLLEGTLTCPELVVMTGSAIWNRTEGRFVDIHLLPSAEVPAMLEVFDRQGLQPFCYVLNRDGHRLDVFHGGSTLSAIESGFVDERSHLALKNFHLSTRCPEQDYGRVALFFGMGTERDIVSVTDNLRSISSCYVSHYKDTYSDDLWFLEVFAPSVSKAAGMLRLKQRLGVDRVVAFGDNLNDIPMLKAADLGVAVGNALDPVKEIAGAVIGPNTENSVARFIKSMFE